MNEIKEMKGMNGIKGRLRESLEKGRVAYGMGIFSGSQSIVEIAGFNGFDFLYVDTHISPLSLETAQPLVAASYASGITPLIRVTENDWNMIDRALNLGCEGVVVPHINNRNDAEIAVNSAKYAPQGNRGCCPNQRGSQFCNIPWEEYTKKANELTWMIPLVESKEGLENFEDIISVKGIDIVYIGPHDLSISLGVPGKDFTDPIMKEALEEMLKICKKRGVKSWTTTVQSMSRDYTEMLKGMGFNMISYNTDLGIFHRACLKLLKGDSL